MNILDRLDELEREATRGPWRKESLREVNRESDRSLIALSRNHLRALIEVARAAQYVRDAWLIIEADDAHLMNACARLDPALAPLLEEGGER